ncbi:MAG: hypothetical protein ACXABY_12875 [Candidatus Thorarchaeota archaeon]|jgi:hypothetical protein
MAELEDFVIDVVDIRNVGKSLVQIGVAPPDEEMLLGTDITPFDGSFLFDGSGIVKIYPGKRFVIEENRVNRGQIETLASSGQVQALFQRRLLSEITDVS